MTQQSVSVGPSYDTVEKYEQTNREGGDEHGDFSSEPIPGISISNRPTCWYMFTCSMDQTHINNRFRGTVMTL